MRDPGNEVSTIPCHLSLFCAQCCTVRCFGRPDLYLSCNLAIVGYSLEFVGFSIFTVDLESEGDLQETPVPSTTGVAKQEPKVNTQVSRE